ncbi:MAG: DUF420 domain-containing protein, partial [Alphaproteobacteria bacterium]
MDSYDPDSKNSESSNDIDVYIVIGFLSFVVLAFLFWLIYFKTGTSLEGEVSWVNSLPTLNAFLNTLTSIFLITGYKLIKQNKVQGHKLAMYFATITSALFLVSYIAYHHY